MVRDARWCNHQSVNQYQMDICGWSRIVPYRTFNPGVVGSTPTRPTNHKILSYDSARKPPDGAVFLFRGKPSIRYPD